ncbi:hypothetical protein [Candidatus Palauibacter sp.]
MMVIFHSKIRRFTDACRIVEKYLPPMVGIAAVDLILFWLMAC